MKRNKCPQCGGDVRLELSINYFVCNRCCETLTAEDLVRECDREFGEHEHDDRECARMLDEMSGGSHLEHMEWERESYNRELEAESLGRPLFPNEY